MKPVHIRGARAFDARPILRLLQTIARHEGATPRDTPLSDRDVAAWMAEATAWHVAEQAGEIIGLQWLEPHPDLPPTTCDIATFTAPSVRGIDIGARLFDATRKAAKTAGFTHIRTRIRATNDGGLIYYQSRGFERLTPRDDPASGRPPVRHVEMTYRL